MRGSARRCARSTVSVLPLPSCNAAGALAIAHLLEANPRTPEKWPRLARSYLEIAAADARISTRLLKTRTSRSGPAPLKMYDRLGQQRRRREHVDLTAGGLRPEPKRGNGSVTTSRSMAGSAITGRHPP